MNGFEKKDFTREHEGHYHLHMYKEQWKCPVPTPPIVQHVHLYGAARLGKEGGGDGEK